VSDGWHHRPNSGCEGLVPRVTWTAGYGPKLWIRSVPSNSNWLEKHTPCTRYGHHSWLKRRGRQPKKNQTQEQSAPSHFLITIDMGRKDFTTCLPNSPPSLNWDGPRHPGTPSRSFQYHIDFTRCQGLRKWWLYYLIIRDVATCRMRTWQHVLK
jgi:hypothetical protein